jgi:hypothetical protein
MDPKAGRFTAMDSWKGRSSSPVTLNKYLYADDDSVNLKDPSGHMSVGTLAPPSVALTLSTTAINAGFGALTRFSVRLLLVAGTTALGGSSQISSAATDKARNQLKNDILRKALALGASATQVLYHYTTDLANAKSIFFDKEIISSGGFRHSDGIYRPEGAYATPLPPFLGGGMTQRELARRLFDTPGKGWVQFFVAFVKSPPWRPIAGDVEYYHPAPAGGGVPIVPIAYGASLISP